MLMTNVPGPRTPIHLAGIPLADLIVFAPTSGSIGLGLSFISYAGILRLGVYADSGVVADPENIVRAFEDEYKNITAGFGTPSISPKRTV